MTKFKWYTIILFLINCNDTLGLSFADSNSTLCENGKCLKKCCPADEYVLYRKKKKCGNYSSPLYIDLPIYDGELKRTAKTMDHFNFEEFGFQNILFKNSVYDISRIFNIYLTESGKLYLESPNAYRRWQVVNTSSYCIDFWVPSDKPGLDQPRLGVWAILESGNSMIQGNTFFTISMIVSCVFMVLVLVVYFILPELRNLGGLVLMAYVFSLLCAFVFLMIVQRGGHSPAGCVGLTLSVYFFFLASFCWMNIMSYDIWWTFRGYAKARPIHRRGEKFKFAMYCLYAWGVPLGMGIMLLVLNYTDLKHIPWFIAPKIPEKGCFLEGGEKLLYLYVPMLIMIVLNWLFFLMTAFNIWRLSRGTSVLDSAAAGTPAAHRTHRHRLLVYLKLSILMGLNWILEVVSSFKPDLNIWYISDAYNLFIGVAIFLIFVCKKKIFKKLLKRYRARRQSKGNFSFKSRSSSRSNSTTDSSHVTHETQPLQICINPHGPM